jgi:hypothetical protein
VSALLIIAFVDEQSAHEAEGVQWQKNTVILPMPYALLRKALIRSNEGDRRFTSEWILYNILEMKFIEGRKVREVAGRLAMSEADLYRKQRVAVEAVARAILDMEQNEVLQ